MLFHVVRCFLSKIIHCVSETLNSFRTTLLQRAESSDRAQKTENEETHLGRMCLQITTFPTHTHTRNPFIHSWQRFSFISLIWTILLFFTASSLTIIHKCSHKCKSCGASRAFGHLMNKSLWSSVLVPTSCSLTVLYCPFSTYKIYKF